MQSRHVDLPVVNTAGRSTNGQVEIVADVPYALLFEDGDDGPIAVQGGEGLVAAQGRSARRGTTAAAVSRAARMRECGVRRRRRLRRFLPWRAPSRSLWVPGQRNCIANSITTLMDSAQRIRTWTGARRRNSGAAGMARGDRTAMVFVSAVPLPGTGSALPGTWPRFDSAGHVVAWGPYACLFTAGGHGLRLGSWDGKSSKNT